LRQLSRLTVSVEDVTEAQQLTTNNDTLKQFDIIAATPSNMKVFAHLCKQADVDIIALDLTHRQSFSINKKLVGIYCLTTCT
jgi:RNase P/RNase MRP subunit p30